MNMHFRSDRPVIISIPMAQTGRVGSVIIRERICSITKGHRFFSVCDGTVEKLGWNRLGGERVGVRGKDGHYYYYAHLDKINQELYIDKK
jgi:hypothetical protein